MFPKKTLKNIDVKDKTVLLRVDYNIPTENSKVESDYRIERSLKTIKALLKQNAKVVLLAHNGRPKGKDKTLSLKPMAERLSEFIEPVEFMDKANARQIRKSDSRIFMLENLRFDPREKQNNDEFAKELASLGDIFVQDAFGVVHRANTSTAAICKYLPSVAGMLLEEEYTKLHLAIEHPKDPLVAIIGGAKIEDKIELLERFIQKADRIIVGGALANTFLAAKDISVGNSVFDKDEVGIAKDIIVKATNEGVELILPLQDVAVAEKTSGQRQEKSSSNISEKDMILDLGEKSISSIITNIEDAGTIIWNGPLGYTEKPEFELATEEVAKFIARKKLNCLVGGGDTVAVLERLKLITQIKFVSTGGGAMLELLAGKNLPGVEALLDK